MERVSVWERNLGRWKKLPGTRDYEEQDPLREYIQALLRGWWLIALLVFLAVLAAGVFSLLMMPTFETRAGVLIAKSGIEVSFEDQMRTLSESDLALLSGAYWRDQEGSPLNPCWAGEKRDHRHPGDR